MLTFSLNLTLRLILERPLDRAPQTFSQLRHVQGNKEHAVLVSKLSVVLVDGTGMLEMSTIVEQLVFAESKVFLCASTGSCVNEGRGGRGGSRGSKSERVGG